MVSRAGILGSLIIFVCCPHAYSLDTVRQSIGADDVQSVMGLAGRGVVVAILDRGIDIGHPDFRKPDGSTRIKYLLDLTGQNLCRAVDPPGRAFDEAAINTLIANGPPYPTDDFVGHGTVTAGIAAGSGAGLLSRKYRGIASDADLIIIKMTSEGAPASSRGPGEAGFQGCIDEALDWLNNRLNDLGNPPCVALINSGVQWGPQDGTSVVSRKIDEVFGEHNSGRVYVAASGDEGGLGLHAGGTFTSAGTIVAFSKLRNDWAFFNLWYDGQSDAEITITYSDGSTEGPYRPNDFDFFGPIQVAHYLPGREFYPWTSTSGDHAVWMFIDKPLGTGTIQIRSLAGAGPFRFDIYNADIRFDSGPRAVVRFDDFRVEGAITDYATTKSAIVVGASVVRTTYQDIDGVHRTVSSDGFSQDLYRQSGRGPTRDGRQGVDLVAPGHNIMSAYGQQSYWSAFRWNLVSDGAGLYGRGGGTSGSAPVVVGAIALLLELDPSLTASEIRSVLHDTARFDARTGGVPNTLWGHGRLDLYRAALTIARAVSPCAGDADGSGNVDFDDITNVLSNWLADYAPNTGPGDANADSVVNFDDITAVLSNWLVVCP